MTSKELKQEWDLINSELNVLEKRVALLGKNAKLKVETDKLIEELRWMKENLKGMMRAITNIESEEKEIIN